MDLTLYQRTMEPGQKSAEGNYEDPGEGTSFMGPLDLTLRHPTPQNTETPSSGNSNQCDQGAGMSYKPLPDILLTIQRTMSLALSEVRCKFLDEEAHQSTSSSTSKVLGDHWKKSSKGEPIMVYEDPSVVKALGPIGVRDIFSGFAFVFTSSSNRNTYVGPHFPTTSEATAVFDVYTSVHPYDLLRLRRQVLDGGGVLLNSLMELSNNNYRNLIVIAEKPCITPSYLMAVSCSIPIYSHDVIIKACKEGQHIAAVLPCFFTMPLGRLYSSGNWIIVSKFRRRPRRFFKGIYFYFALPSVNPDTLTFWRRIVVTHGGTVGGVNEGHFDPDGVRNCDIVLADEEMEPWLWQNANLYNKPIATLGWIIDAVVLRRSHPPLPFEHPIFHPLILKGICIEEDEEAERTRQREEENASQALGPQTPPHPNPDRDDYHMEFYAGFRGFYSEEDDGSRSSSSLDEPPPKLIILNGEDIVKEREREFDVNKDETKISDAEIEPRDDHPKGGKWCSEEFKRMMEREAEIALATNKEEDEVQELEEDKGEGANQDACSVTLEDTRKSPDLYKEPSSSEEGSDSDNRNKKRKKISSDSLESYRRVDKQRKHDSDDEEANRIRATDFEFHSDSSDDNSDRQKYIDRFLNSFQ